MDALQHAIDRAGGVGRLATAIGVAQTAVSNWKSRGVPVEQCPAIESATGVRCDDLRGDVIWLRDGQGAIAGYQVPLKGAA